MQMFLLGNTANVRNELKFYYLDLSFYVSMALANGNNNQLQFYGSLNHTITDVLYFFYLFDVTV